ncbi:MAG: LysM peptidoglycan-binding domain-containing protein [Cyanobacteriota bacterium]|nr:LysM peptidoglycan-binding domain-containing protein [Cyanobacteriota bacterium]
MSQQDLTAVLEPEDSASDQHSSDSSPHRPSVLITAIAAALGLSGGVVLIPDTPTEMISPSSETLTAVLQQNYQTKQIQAEAFLESGSLTPLPGIRQHTLQAGETLWALTQIYQVDAAAIAVANNITAQTSLEPGQILAIPTQPGIIYTVKARDTLETIAQRFKVAQTDIIQATPLTTPNFLQIGQQLLIPGDVKQLLTLQREPQPMATQPQPIQKSPFTHTVQAGETVERIASLYGVTQQAIIQVNQLANPGWLSLGQKLTIPDPVTQIPPFAQANSGFTWPVAGQMTSRYGWRWGRMHTGVDIAGAVGSPVAAVMAGTIIFAGDQGDGYGQRVDIQHANGLITRYAHGNQIYVSLGQHVQQGQPVMSRGTSGFVTGPNLHFEVRSAANVALNPSEYLNR